MSSLGLLLVAVALVFSAEESVAQDVTSDVRSFFRDLGGQVGQFLQSSMRTFLQLSEGVEVYFCERIFKWVELTEEALECAGQVYPALVKGFTIPCFNKSLITSEEKIDFVCSNEHDFAARNTSLLCVVRNLIQIRQSILEFEQISVIQETRACFSALSDKFDKEDVFH